MTSVTTCTTTKSWFEARVPTPAVGQELYLAMHLTEQEYERVYGRKPEHDDAFEVLSTEDLITIRFELREAS